MKGQFKDGTKCEECGEEVKKDSWVRFIGKYFCKKECQEKYEARLESKKEEDPFRLKSKADLKRRKSKKKKSKGKEKRRPTRSRRIKR